MAPDAHDDRKAARREEILAAAYREFADKGYAGASMERIARRARASKETLYSWFQNKQTLFTTLFNERLNQVSAGPAAALRENPHPSHVLPVIARDVLKLQIAMAPLAPAGYTAGRHTSRMTRQIGKSIREERKNFVGYLEWCRAQGYIAHDDDLFEIASLFVAMAQGEWTVRLATGMVDEVTDAMMEEHAQRVTRLFLKAVAPTARSTVRAATK